jgi:hypothetical protein
MFFATESFRINLVNGFGARGSRCKPSVCGSSLDAADKIAIAKCLVMIVIGFSPARLAA